MHCAIHGTPQSIESLKGGELCYVQDIGGTRLALISEERSRGDRVAVFLVPSRGYEDAPGDRYLSAMRSRRVFKLADDGFSIVPNLLSAEISPESFGTDPGTIVQVDDTLFLAFHAESDVAYLRIRDGQIYSRPPDGERAYFAEWALEWERNGEVVVLANFPYDRTKQDGSNDG